MPFLALSVFALKLLACAQINDLLPISKDLLLHILNDRFLFVNALLLFLEIFAQILNLRLCKLAILSFFLKFLLKVNDLLLLAEGLILAFDMGLVSLLDLRKKRGNHLVLFPPYDFCPDFGTNSYFLC